MAIRDLILRDKARSPERRREEEGLSSFQRDVNRLFDEFFRDAGLVPATGRENLPGSPFTPRINVAETDQEFTVSAELPGLDEKDVAVELDQDTLTIRGERKQEREEKGRNWHRREYTYGAFHRAVPFPARIDANKVKAVFKKGILTVSLPKLEPGKGRQKAIRISAT